MRSVYHRLGHTLEFFVLQLVYKERQHYGYWESPQYAVEAQQYGVCDHTGAVIVAEKAFEPFEPHPLATEEAVHGVEVPEGYLYAVNGRILEDGGNDYRDEQQQIVFPVLCYPPAQAVPRLDGGSGL